jgi:hypothetical protein
LAGGVSGGATAVASSGATWRNGGARFGQPVCAGVALDALDRVTLLLDVY